MSPEQARQRETVDDAAEALIVLVSPLNLHEFGAVAGSKAAKNSPEAIKTRARLALLHERIQAYLGLTSVD